VDWYLFNGMEAEDGDSAVTNRYAGFHMAQSPKAATESLSRPSKAPITINQVW